MEGSKRERKHKLLDLVIVFRGLPSSSDRSKVSSSQVPQQRLTLSIGNTADALMTTNKIGAKLEWRNQLNSQKEREMIGNDTPNTENSHQNCPFLSW